MNDQFFTGRLIASIVGLALVTGLAAAWTFEQWRRYRQMRQATRLRAARASQRPPALPEVQRVAEMSRLRVGVGGLAHRAPAPWNPASRARELGYSDLLKED